MATVERLNAHVVSPSKIKQTEKEKQNRCAEIHMLINIILKLGK